MSGIIYYAVTVTGAILWCKLVFSREDTGPLEAVVFVAFAPVAFPVTVTFLVLRRFGRWLSTPIKTRADALADDPDLAQGYREVAMLLDSRNAECTGKQ
jgi:hypothetical protein